MKYRAIIFDMDGTIINTEGIWERATEKLITQRGQALPPHQKEEILAKTHGLHVRASCSLLKEVLYLEDSLESLMQELEVKANESYEQGVSFIEGFHDFHATVKAHKLKSGIATNASASTVEITIKTLNLDTFFGRHIYNVSHVNNVGKPHPALYLHAAKNLRVKPENCIAIEDSAHGIAAAKGAGMFCIGINTSKNRALLKQADLIIDQYHEIDLPDLLELTAKGNND